MKKILVSKTELFSLLKEMLREVMAKPQRIEDIKKEAEENLRKEAEDKEKKALTDKS
jgi:hypothetical protein